MKNVLCSVVFALAVFGPLEAAADADRPNVVFIIADDQSPFDLDVYDPASKLERPHISRLAAEGMVFDGAYHMGSFSGAVCTPSRHMVMRGRTVWHLPNAAGAIKNGLCPEGVEASTMAAVFNAAGYDTRDGTPRLLAKYGATNHTDRNSLPAANEKKPGKKAKAE